MPIQLLSNAVVDQIAAGEVVERPAHLVKEIVENSLDAGASEIEVEYDFGGRYVRVKDNGQGIPREELHLAVARHATSKIQLSSDIWNIHSYGFRGEALATIGAVSRLKLVSRPATQAVAAQINLDFGQSSEVMDSGGDFGTTITVSDLFENVPARLKFLKSDAAESIQIKTVLKGLALANPHVSFRVKQKNELIFYWPRSESFKDRVEQVLDISPLFEGNGENDQVKAQVVIAPPELRERSSRQIWVLVQNRLITDRGLQAAVTEAYRHLMMHGDYPVAVVSVTCPTEFVDINIHPTKSAVKFQNQQNAFKSVHRAVRGVLEAAPWNQMRSTPSRIESSETIVRNHQPDLSNLNTQVSRTVQQAVELQGSLLGHIKEQPVQYAQRQNFVRDHKSEYSQNKGGHNSVNSYRPKEDFPSLHELKQAASVGKWGRMQVLGQAHLTYIVAQDENCFYLVDQHAAHERVAFEKLMLKWKGGQIDLQQFLFPLELSLDSHLVESLWRAKDELLQLGVELCELGELKLGVLAAPSLMSEKALNSSLRQMAEEAARCGGSYAVEKSIGDICATMACHSVVRAGQSLSLEQMRSLLMQMDEFPLSGFCPHGRPVSIEWNWFQIERDFGRTV